jgi:hypothetical protein
VWVAVQKMGQSVPCPSAISDPATHASRGEGQPPLIQIPAFATTINLR